MVTLLFSGAAILFFGIAIAAVYHLQWAHRLPKLEQSLVASDQAQIHCSVVVAARNEEARIESTIRHLLQQQGVTLQVIVVDDRSSDRTGDILTSLAAGDHRLHTVRVDDLPEGWLGKCHACWKGAMLAQGEWILFTDADCWLQPNVIARALQAAEREDADHVTLAPGLVLESLATRAWYLMFLVSASSWIAGVNRDRRRSYLGVGAFNLVRAGAYLECGGYQALRLSVVDDLKLGLLLRRAGKRTRAFLAAHEVECHWGTRVRDMIRIMEKNYFAVLNFSTPLAALALTAATLGFGVLLLGLFSGTAAGLIAAISPLSLILPALVLARRLGWPWPSALAVPFMLPVFMYALFNSTYVTLRQGGIRWRDTFYPLEQLRAGGVK